jgi:hypothetical protein
MSLSAMTGGLLVSGQLPALAGPGDVPKPGVGVDKHLGPWAAKPVVGYRKEFRPAKGKVTENYQLTYRILQWSSPRQPGMAKCNEIGQLVITKKGSRFTIDQRADYSKTNNHLNADIVCSGVAPTSWTVETQSEVMKPSPRTRMTEKGQAKGETITIDNGHFKTQLAAQNPLITQWTVLDELMKNDPKTIKRKVDLLQDLHLLKPNHRLFYEGVVSVPSAVGDVKLTTVAEVGYGINPIHYLIDGEGRVQLVTNAITSWTLESIKPV